MALSDAQAREILRTAWQNVHGRAPTARELLYSQAIARLETGYGRAGQFGALAARGQYNWGALQTRSKSADGECPPGTAPGSDQGSVCFFVYPTDVAAAAAFLTTLTKKHWPVIEAMRGTPEDVARAMRVPPAYYAGTGGSEADRQAVYARAIRNAIAAIGEPVPEGLGPAPGTMGTLGRLAVAGALGYAAYRLYRTYGNSPTPRLRRS